MSEERDVPVMKSNHGSDSTASGSLHNISHAKNQDELDKAIHEFHKFHGPGPQGPNIPKK